MIECKQCKQHKDSSEMSKNGYQRKTGQAKVGLCKKCNNANLIAYKHIKADSNQLLTVLTGYKALIDTVHGGVIPMALPKYIRDAVLYRWPDYSVEISKRNAKSDYDEANDIANYFGNIAHGSIAADALDKQTSNVSTVISEFKRRMSTCPSLKHAISVAETSLVAARKSLRKSFFTEWNELKQQVQELEDAIYAGTDTDIVVAGYTFTVDDIDDRGMCECTDAGDCFCDTCLNFVTVAKKLLDATEDK